MTATFLASTPMRGLGGLFFDDFAASPPWQKNAKAPRWRQGRAARQVYATSMALTGSPAAQWKSEATMVMRGAMARQRARAAQVRRQEQQRVDKRRASGPRELDLGEFDAEDLLKEAEESRSRWPSSGRL